MGGLFFTLNSSTNLFLASNDRIKLAFTGALCQIGTLQSIKELTNKCALIIYTLIIITLLHSLCHGDQRSTYELLEGLALLTLLGSRLDPESLWSSLPIFLLHQQIIIIVSIHFNSF